MGVLDDFLKVLVDRIFKSILSVVATVKRCILQSAHDLVVCGCSLPSKKKFQVEGSFGVIHATEKYHLAPVRR